MGICDPACVKNIINSGIMAQLIPAMLSASDLRMEHASAMLNNAAIGDQALNPAKQGSRAFDLSARRLHATASDLVATYDFLVKRGAINANGQPDWQGCDQASKIAQWTLDLADGGTFDYAAATSLMDQWRHALLQQTHSLVSGSL